MTTPMTTPVAPPAPPGATPQVAYRSARVRRGVVWGLATLVPLTFLGLFFAYPVLEIVGRGFVHDGAPDLGGFAEVFGRRRTWRIIGLTLGQQSWLRMLNIDHHQVMPGTSASMAPGFETRADLEATKASADYWAHA